jgi:hypothetical protein
MPEYEEDDYGPDEDDEESRERHETVENLRLTSYYTTNEPEEDETEMPVSAPKLVTNLTRNGYIHTLPRRWYDAMALSTIYHEGLDGASRWTTRHLTQSTQLQLTYDAIARRVSAEPREIVIARHQRLDRRATKKTSISKASMINIPRFTDVILADASTNIDRVGVELEGGWNDAQDFEIFGDGSVNVTANYVGEAHTYPRPYSLNDESTIDAFNRQFENMYPDRVDNTCGMHVHVSFKSIGAYNAFVCNEFADWVIAGLKAWGANTTSSNLKRRLAGENSFAETTYDAQTALRQCLTRNKHDAPRYTAVNYCYNTHGTMEVRVLPMFKDKAVGQAAVKALIHLISLWDIANSPKIRKPQQLAQSELPTGEPVPHTPVYWCGATRPFQTSMTRGNVYPYRQNATTPIVYANCACDNCYINSYCNSRAGLMPFGTYNVNESHHCTMQEHQMREISLEIIERCQQGEVI